MVSKELALYRYVEHWKPDHRILPVTFFLNKKDPYFKLFENVYKIVQGQCSLSPIRKNGEPCFIHPINVALNLKRAGVTDGLTLCIGLLHDLVEDRVDVYQKKEGITLKEGGVRCLRCYEKKMYLKFMDEIKEYCTLKDREILVKGIMALTRTKRTFYYKSIADLYTLKDLDIKKRVIQVKLADRLHNILCIDSFSEEQRIYECFKNLFILNNAKKFILDNYPIDVFDQVPSSSITTRLFKKCCKATYDGFLRICGTYVTEKTDDIRSMLQLAFRKFVFQKGGLWDITRLDDTEIHPVRLFQGVIRKYDARLLGNLELFNERERNEKNYCRKFFADYKFTENDLRAIIYYKDAYALKEIVAKLLYDPEYVLPGFLTTDLSKEGRIKV